MKPKTIFFAALLIFAGAWFQSTAQAQKTNPNPKYNPPKEVPKNVKIALPDLRITKFSIEGSKISVQVTNQCQGVTPMVRLSMVIYKGEDKNSGADLIVENDVPPLKGGAQVNVQLNVTGTKFDSGIGDRFYRLEVDSTNKVKEAVETNNWWEKGAVPFPDPANVCEPK